MEGKDDGGGSGLGVEMGQRLDNPRVNANRQTELRNISRNEFSENLPVMKKTTHYHLSEYREFRDLSKQTTKNISNLISIMVMAARSTQGRRNAHK